MKTTILQLEGHDDIISVKDKLGWAKSSRVLLVWPERGDVLTRRLDIVMLQRYAVAQGAQLGLVTRRPQVIMYANELAIPVFSSLKKAQSSQWRVPHRLRRALASRTFQRNTDHQVQKADINKRTRLLSEARRYYRPADMHPLLRLLGFTLGVVAFLSLAALFVPYCELVLQPAEQVQEIKMNIQARPDQTAFTLSGGVPAEWAKIVVEGRDGLPSSGTLLLPYQASRGEVVFTNLTDQPVEVPQGTVVRTASENPARFATLRAAMVVAGVGVTQTIPIQALAAGRAGNVPPETIRGIEGLLGARLAVTNPAATSGGSDRRSPAPTERDRQALYKRLTQALKQSAMEQLHDTLADGDVLLPDTIKLIRIAKEEFEPPAGEPADRLTLSLQLEYQAQVVRKNDLHMLASAVLDGNLPTGFVPLKGSLEVISLTEPEIQVDGAATWQALARRRLKASLPETEIIRLVLGLPPEEARSRLMAALPLADAPRIALFPGWWPRLPFLPLRVSVEEEPPEG